MDVPQKVLDALAEAGDALAAAAGTDATAATSAAAVTDAQATATKDQAAALEAHQEANAQAAEAIQAVKEWLQLDAGNGGPTPTPSAKPVSEKVAGASQRGSGTK